MAGRTIKVERSLRYARLRDELPGDVRRALEFAEEAVIVDPFHRHGRHERSDGTVADWNEPPILLLFRLEGDVLLFTDFHELD